MGTASTENSTLVEFSEDGNSTAEGNEDLMRELRESLRYRVVVPLLIAACLVTFCMNAVIVVSFPLIRNLSRVRCITSEFPT